MNIYWTQHARFPQSIIRFQSIGSLAVCFVWTILVIFLSNKNFENHENLYFSKVNQKSGMQSIFLFKWFVWCLPNNIESILHDHLSKISEIKKSIADVMYTYVQLYIVLCTYVCYQSFEDWNYFVHLYEDGSVKVKI